MSEIKEKNVKPMGKEFTYEMDKYKEIVTGVIKNNENPGAPIEFWFKGEGVPEITKFSFQDNEMIKIPLGLAKHLNKNCWVARDKFILDDKGRADSAIGKKERRFSFFPLGYVETEDLSEEGVPMAPIYKV